MTKDEVATALDEIGTLLQLKGESDFRVRAYTNGARVVAQLEGDLKKMVTDGKLSEVRGIGDTLQEKITTLVTTGKLKYYDDLKASVPPGLVEMLKFRAKNLNQAHVYPVGALTVQLKGTQLTEMAELREHGCVAFSHADAPLDDSQVMMRAMQYAATFGFTVILRPHPKLNENQRRAIARDYCMEKEKLAVPMRLALLYYFVRRLDLDPYDEMPNKSEKERHVVLDNKDEVKAALERAH